MLSGKCIKLPCKYVIHTVGPIWRGGNYGEPEFLANCYKNSLQTAVENNIHTIAFPSISTGVYNFPVQYAAEIAVKTVRKFIAENPEKFDIVMWVLFDEHTEKVYQTEVKKFI